jgi:hypothetical protein
VSAEGKKYQQVQYLPAFQVDSLGVCALWKNAVVKKVEGCACINVCALLVLMLQKEIRARE